MPDSLLTNSKIIAAYREKTRKSSELAEKARETFPSGITHDSRHRSLRHLCRSRERFSEMGCRRERVCRFFRRPWRLNSWT